ncbi:Protein DETOXIFICATION 15 [Glycine max]|nr:Protein DETOXIFICATION 15 [Glycine max]
MDSLKAWTFELMVLLSGLLPNPHLNTFVIAWMIPFGLSCAVSTRVSNELGAGHPQAASLAVRVALFLVLADGIMMVLVMILLRKIWGNLYSSDTHVIKYVAAVMPILATCSFLDGIQSVLSGIARGSGWQKIGAIVNLGSFYFVGVPSSVVLAFVLHMKGKGLWLGIVSAFIVQVILFGVITIRTSWDKEIGMASAVDTFCGQSYGAQQYHMVGIHTQRVIVVIMLATAPMSFIWAYLRPVLVVLHQDKTIAAKAQLYARYLIPSLSANALLRCITKFLQTHNTVLPIVLASGFTTLAHVLICWLLVLRFGLGIKGAAIAFCISNWLNTVLLALYINTMISNELGAGCPKAAYLAVKNDILTSANPLGCEKGIVRGCGWQKLGAFVNVGSYYLVDLPFAIVLAFVLHIKGEANKAAKRVRINGVQPDANALPSDQNENRRQLNSHLDELLLASASLATSFVNATGFNVLMGMSSALDTFCGQAYGAKQFHMLGLHTQGAMLVLTLVTIPLSIIWVFLGPILIALRQDKEIAAHAQLYARYLIPSLSANALLRLNTSGIFWMIPFGISAAGSTRISNELGAGSPKAAYLAVKVTMFLASAVGILEFASLMLLWRVWGHVFTNVHEVVKYVTSMMPLVASSTFIDSIQTAFQGVARGCGWQKLGAYVNLGSYYFLGVPFSVVSAFVFHMKGQGLFLGILIALIVQVVCFLLVTLRANWEKEAKKAATRVGGSGVQLEDLPRDQNVNIV